MKDYDHYATFYAKLEKAGHVLKKDEDGKVDYFAFSYEIHNGPECIKCGEVWCQHCEGRPDFICDPCAE